VYENDFQLSFGFVHDVLNTVDVLVLCYSSGNTTAASGDHKASL